MKRLLLICLICVSCKSKSQQVINDQLKKDNKVDSLKVDQSLLSENEREYLKSIDSISVSIDWIAFL